MNQEAGIMGARLLIPYSNFIVPQKSLSRKKERRGQSPVGVGSSLTGHPTLLGLHPISSQNFLLILNIF